MLGAIIGDIVGSPYESRHNQIKAKDFYFFNSRCRFTDDSICTAAVADILLHGLPPAETMQRWCRHYRRRGYGGVFKRWIYWDEPEPYESYGNGAAMRVSPAAFLHQQGDLAAALAASDHVTAITHNHPEGIKGARATTHAIWLAYQGETVAAIRETIAAEYSYDLNQTVDEIRPNYSFDSSCQGTVPQAITCALESDSFEDAVRNAVSLGGDADTLAAIAGPIAEALHGIPQDIKEVATNRYLVDALGDALDIYRIIRMMYQIMYDAVSV